MPLVILLALDTCDARGSLALLRDNDLLRAVAHEGTSDYSGWVLPTAEVALRSSSLAMRDVEVFAVASGPGSFTGVRIALTTVKAWSEAYGIAIVSVSRLEALASESANVTNFVAASFNANRNQVYGGLFRAHDANLRLVEQEMVAAPADFISWVAQRTGEQKVSWISMDPELLTSQQAWQARRQAGETLAKSSNVLAPAIARIGRQRALAGRYTDVLALDAEYIRRPDAEVYWKGGPVRGS
jgi:tRNA threonylcarbamoyladenosine biosynthesis protein TsaB